MVNYPPQKEQMFHVKHFRSGSLVMVPLPLCQQKDR